MKHPLDRFAGALSRRGGLGAALMGCLRPFSVLGMLGLLTACDAGPNHLGNPLLLPVRALGAVAENSVYDARRSRVRSYLIANAGAVRQADAPTVETLWELAGVPAERRSFVIRDLQALGFGPDWAEQATVTVMVHSR